MVTSDSSPVAFEVQSVQRPRQQVEQQIRVAILTGVLTAGQKLPNELALSRDFGVSRTTVREALRSLVADGLIEKIPGASGGSFVRLLDHNAFGVDLGQDIEQLLRNGSFADTEASETRRMIEIPCVRLAAEHRSEDDVMELRAILDREKLLHFDDPAVPELDVHFHTIIGRASGNRIVAAFVAALHHVTEPVHHLKLNAEVGKRTVRQHMAIARAIEQRDPDAAEVAMRDHLSYLERHPRS